MNYKPMLTAVALLSIAGTAHAHPKLLSVNPAANATITAPAHIVLRFSEKLMAVADDGKMLVVTPKARLARGRYIVEWRVVSSDTHKVAGRYAFAVK
jgi:methionine-rich copper-binding protein CopC